MGVEILGVGKYIPPRVLTNFDLEKILDTSDKWITTRTGIKERHIAEEWEKASDLALKACEEALENSRLNKKDIEAVIVATSTPDMIFPSTGCFLADKLGLNKPMAFDLSAACSGFIYGLTIGSSLLKSGQFKNVLVVGAEVFSQILDWSDRSTAVIFGDGAGAVILSLTDSDSDILSAEMKSDGSHWGSLNCPVGEKLRMRGRETFKLAIKSMETASKKALEKANLTLDDIKLIIPHQANIRIINTLAERLNIPEEKVFSNIHKYGNTSAASIPIALYDTMKEGKIKKGDNILLTAFGGGLSWGSIVLRY